MRADWDVSIRRACSVLEVDTSTSHYWSRRHDQAGIAARIKEICANRVRYGHRRVQVMLRREAWTVSAKKVHRTTNELGVLLRNERCRNVGSQRSCATIAKWPSDPRGLGDGFRPRPVGDRGEDPADSLDTFSRFSPIVCPQFSYRPRFSYRAENVVLVLEQSCAVIGYPKAIRVDRGSEFISRDLDLCACGGVVSSLP